MAAAKGGATSTTTVDLSSHYLEWAHRNFALNKLKPGRNVTVAADVLEWVAQPAAHGKGPKPRRPVGWTDASDPPGVYDLIYLDPPTFSNSKKMGRATFDVQRDHADLLRVVCRRLLAPGGTLLFANNFRKFKLDADALDGRLRARGPVGRHPAARLRAPAAHASPLEGDEEAVGRGRGGGAWLQPRRPRALDPAVLPAATGRVTRTPFRDRSAATPRCRAAR